MLILFLGVETVWMWFVLPKFRTDIWIINRLETPCFRFRPWNF